MEPVRIKVTHEVDIQVDATLIGLKQLLSRWSALEHAEQYVVYQISTQFVDRDGEDVEKVTITLSRKEGV